VTGWLVAWTVRRAPRRLLLGAVGVAFSVAMLAATLLFVDGAVHTMTRTALAPVRVEMKALATSLNVGMGAMSRQLARVPGVRRAERFAAADVVVTAQGTSSRATARLFAVDPAYLRNHAFPRVVSGTFGRGALLNPALHGTAGFGSARRIAIDLPGQGRPLGLSLPVGGVADMRTATSWFEIPTGGVQGDVAIVPRSIVIDYPTFVRTILPAAHARLGATTPVLNPDLADLPPVTLESHITVDHRIYPSDPGAAATWSSALRRRLERQAPGRIVVADNAVEVLNEANVDAGDAKILFLLLGIPGALAAAALGLSTESALAEANRREDALLRLRGAMEGQLVRLAVANAVAAGVVGTILGFLVAAAAVSAVIGHAVWQDASTEDLVVAALLGLLAGALTTAARLIVRLRAARRADVVAERQLVRPGWRPLWLRARLDLVAIAVGVAILAIDAASGGLHQTPIQGPSVALSFYVLLAPIALWIGLTLLAVRVLLAAADRRVASERARPLGTWRGAAMRWLARRPARTAVALLLGVLAVAFAAEVVTFVGTYTSAKTADAHAAFGSDMRLTPQPSDLPPPPPSAEPHVAATTPIRYVGARVDTDRKTILVVDPASYDPASSVAPKMVAGKGLGALTHDPRGVLVAKEIATDFEVKPGDPLPLTLFPDDEELKRNANLHVVGIYRSFPPDAPPAELVMTTRSFAPFLLPPPDFYLARTLAGHTPSAVAGELSGSGITRAYAISTSTEATRAGQRTLTALNLTGLSRIAAIGAGLIAAVGIAVLGAFTVLERRREFAILRAVGAGTPQLLASPAQEGAIAVLGSLALGLPIGVALGVVSVRVLELFFTLPPPLVTVPGESLVALAALVVAVSALALCAALAAVTRIAPAEVLREP
jgi:putative ABC transport system permease protein